MPKRWIVFYLFFGILLSFLTGCREVAAPGPDVPKPPSFRENTQEISFAQQDDQMGFMFQSFSNDNIPNEPIKVVTHLENLRVSLQLKETSISSKEKFLEQIQIDGTTNYKLTEDPNASGYYHLDFLRVIDTLTVKLGDIPTITIEKRSPVEVMIESIGLQGPSFIRNGLGNVYQMSANALISDLDKHLVLSFSESMDTTLRSTHLPKGNWLNEKQYKLHLEGSLMSSTDRDIYFILLDKFIAKSGNHPIMGSGITVSQVRGGAWLSLDTNERIGWSDSDHFYSSIVFSPDRSRYIGIAELIYDNGHNIEFFYSFVLEEKGKPPHVIEEEWHTGILQAGTPVQWVDNERIMYADHDKIYMYDLVQRKKDILHDWSNRKDWLQQVAYDPWTKELIMITFRDDDDPEKNEGYHYVYDLYTFSDFTQSKSHVPNFAKAQLVNWPNFPQLPVHVVSHGVYWSEQRDKRMWTRYESRDGKTVSVPGVIKHADDQQVILFDIYYAEETSEWKNAIYIWEYGNDPQKLPDLPHGWITVRNAGPHVFSKTEQLWYRYDSSAGEWSIWNLGNTDPHFSEQGQGMVKLIEKDKAAY